MEPPRAGGGWCGPTTAPGADMTAPLDRLRAARRYPPPGPQGLVKFLAAFSFGLGLGELLAARKLTTTLGLDGREPLVKAFGAREIGAGALTLAAPTAGIASRIAGDLLDIATLAAPVAKGARRGNAAIALVAVLGVTALDIFTFARLRTA